MPSASLPITLARRGHLRHGADNRVGGVALLPGGFGDLPGRTSRAVDHRGDTGECGDHVPLQRVTFGNREVALVAGGGGGSRLRLELADDAVDAGGGFARTVGKR